MIYKYYNIYNGFVVLYEKFYNKSGLFLPYSAYLKNEIICIFQRLLNTLKAFFFAHKQKFNFQEFRVGSAVWPLASSSLNIQILMKMQQ